MYTYTIAQDFFLPFKKKSFIQFLTHQGCHKPGILEKPEILQFRLKIQNFDQKGQKNLEKPGLQAVFSCKAMKF